MCFFSSLLLFLKCFLETSKKRRKRDRKIEDGGFEKRDHVFHVVFLSLSLIFFESWFCCRHFFFSYFKNRITELNLIMSNQNKALLSITQVRPHLFLAGYGCITPSLVIFKGIEKQSYCAGRKYSDKNYLCEIQFSIFFAIFVNLFGICS